MWRKLAAGIATTLTFGAGGLIFHVSNQEDPNFAAQLSPEGRPLSLDNILGREPEAPNATSSVRYYYYSDEQVSAADYLFQSDNAVSSAHIAKTGNTVTLTFDSNKVYRLNDGTVRKIKVATTTPESWASRRSLSFLRRFLNTAEAQTTDTFSTAGYASWITPADVTEAVVACWGGGAGGGDGGSAGGGGGGGGAFASSTVAVTPGTQYTLFIGGNGTGAGSGTAADGTNGATTTFATTTVVAAPGWGGDGNSIIDTVGGLPGAVASSTGTTRFAGGGGGIGRNTSDTGGGGGGAAGPHGAGGAGAAGNTISGQGGVGGTGNNGSGGAGGAGGNGASDPGDPGTESTLGGGGGGGGDDAGVGGLGATYGAGGGGGEGGGGNGAVGACTVTYTVAAAGSTPGEEYTIIFQ